MGASEWQQTCYLVEWYRPSITGELLDHTIDQLDECAASLSSKGSLVQLLMTLAVPSDDVVFGVFEAARSPWKGEHHVGIFRGVLD